MDHFMIGTEDGGRSLESLALRVSQIGTPRQGIAASRLPNRYGLCLRHPGFLSQQH